ncbi:MAG: FtsQ-type POTRA domain-containing protein [Lentisphaeria bacterium]|nr:FtsQ-type POTRA domain-containing protein [Lentisphaeria bacterium]
MAAVRESTAKNSSAGRQDKKKVRNAVLAVFLLLLVSGAAGAGFWGVRKLLFDANPRFLLREIRVNGSGYWKDHAGDLAEKIGLKKGTNLFALDVKKIRKDLARVPNVENSFIYRILPDTLIIRVTERVPRAFLSRENSPLVADGNAVVMPRSQSMRSYARLPVIMDVSLRGIKSGDSFEKIKPAMELIMTAVRDYPDITIYRISLRDPKKLHVYLKYKYNRFNIHHLVLPVRNRGMKFMLMAYQSAVINAHRIGETRNNYDLSYDGKCVIR